MALMLSAYVYYLRSRGLLHGLAVGTNWVFRDESGHMVFAFEVIRVARKEEPELFDEHLKAQIVQMLDEAVACELQFAEDVLAGGVVGLSLRDMRQYLEYVADQRLAQLGLPRQRHYGAGNPSPFMDLQDVQELTNFFERRVSAYAEQDAQCLLAQPQPPETVHSELRAHDGANKKTVKFPIDALVEMLSRVGKPGALAVG